MDLSGIYVDLGMVFRMGVKGFTPEFGNPL